MPTSSSAPITEPFRQADLARCGIAVDPAMFYEPSYRRTLAALVAHVVAIEGPLFEDVLIRRIARAHGLGRAGRTVRDTVLSALNSDCRRSEEDGQTVIWRRGEDPSAVVPFRCASSAVRGHAEIPLAELAGLALASHGAPKADVVRAMALELGLSRVEAATRARLERAAEIAAAAGPFAGKT